MEQNRETDITNEKEIKDSQKSEELFRLPKNIRQIGKEETSRKLYIEDYVLNLMKQLSKRSSMEYQMAVLLGCTVQSDGVLYLFVKGAVEVNKLILDSDEKFTGETWSGIYSQVKQHFHDVDIVGWYLTKPGLPETPDAKLIRIHERNFQDKFSEEDEGNKENKCLLLYDSLEKRENYFIYDHKRFKRAHGYYIYYERNQDMQEYLISHSLNLSIENGYEDVAVKKLRPVILKEIEEKEKAETEKKKKSREEKNTGKKGFGKGRIAFTSLLILFLCIFSAKWNGGEGFPAWNSTKDSDSGEENQNDGKNVNGWMLSSSEDSSETVRGGETAGSSGTEGSSGDDGQDADGLNITELPEITVISGNVNKDDKENYGNAGTGDDEENKGTAGSGDDVENEGNAGNENDPEDVSETGNENNAGDENNSGNGNNSENGDESGDGNSSGGKNDSASGNDGEIGNDGGSENDGGSGNNSENGNNYYTVKQGDTLASISLKHYHTITRAKEIQELNDIEDPDLIFVGQVLLIP